MIIDKSHERKSGILHGWLELIRPPNLFTVPGDILAGASLSRINADGVYLVFPVLVISLFLYISGLILNDYCDREIDRVERPQRPIPSGSVHPRAALVSSQILIGTALCLAYLAGGGMTTFSFHPPSFFLYHRGPVFWAALSIVLLIFLYNGPGRKVPLLGFIILGLCRGCNLFLGASIGARPLSGLVLAGAGVEILYIVSVSAIAVHETRGQPTKLRRCLPLISVSGLALVMMITGASWLKAGVSLFILGWVFFIVWSKRGQKWHGNQQVSTPDMVGKLIRSLILIQAGLIIFSMDYSPVGRGFGYSHYHQFSLAAVLFLFPLSGWVGKKFYGS